MGWLTKLGGALGGHFGFEDLGRDIGGALGGAFGINGSPTTGLAPPMPGAPQLPPLFPTFGPPSEQPPQGFAPTPPQNGNGQFSGDVASLLGGDRLIMEPQMKTIHTAPPGWVIVNMPDGSGKKAVRKEVARCLGLWKSRSKPPISASDWKKLKTANRVKKKAKKIAMTADFKCTKK